MKKITHSIIPLLLFMCIFLFSCTENEHMIFDNTQVAINFNYEFYIPLLDKLLVTPDKTSNFYFSNEEEVKLYFRVKVQGTPSDIDRIIPLEFVNTDTIFNAVAGVDFDIDKDELILPKGEIEKIIPITVYKTDKLADTIVVAQIKLGINNDFNSIGISDLGRINISITNRMKELPWFWIVYEMEVYFNYRNDRVIIKKFMNISGITKSKYYFGHPTIRAANVIKTKKWFNENPTIGEDGEIIKFDLNKK